MMVPQRQTSSTMESFRGRSSLTDDLSLERQILSTAMDAADYEVRLTILGVAGIVVDSSAFKSKQNKKSNVTNPQPTQMSAAIVLSRENQPDAPVSPLSKPFHLAGATTDSTDRFVAIWPGQDKASVDPTFKFVTHLKSLDSPFQDVHSHDDTTTKSQEKIELVVSLSEHSEKSQLALPIAVASLTVDSSLYERGKYILDLPLKPLVEGDQQRTTDAIKLSKAKTPRVSKKKRKEKRGFLNVFSKRQPQGVFESKNISRSQQKAFYNVYRTDPLGDSMLRVQVEVLHKISSHVTLRLKDSPLQSSALGIRTRPSFQSTVTPLHHNIGTSNEEQSTNTFSSGEGAGDEVLTSIEVSAEETLKGEHHDYMDVVRLQFSNGREDQVFTPKESKQALVQDNLEDNEFGRKPTSSALLDTLLPSVGEAKEIYLPTSEAKFEDTHNVDDFSTKIYMIEPHSKEFVDEKKEPEKYDKSISSFDDQTYGEDGTFYTRQGDTTVGNNTFATLGSIDFWTVNGWCTVGKELLNGEIPNVYDGQSIVSAAQYDEHLQRRVQGWKRHLQRMKSEAAVSQALSHASGTFDDTTVTGGDIQSTGASLVRDVRTEYAPRTANLDEEVSLTEQTKQSLAVSHDGSPVQVDAVGTIQGNEAQLSSPVQQQKQNLSQRVAGLFKCEGVQSNQSGDPHGKGGVPKMLNHMELHGATSMDEMTEITNDLVLNGYATTTRLVPHNKNGPMKEAISGCLCPANYHPDDYSLAAMTRDENENYFAEYDDYSFISPPPEKKRIPARAEI